MVNKTIKILFPLGAYFPSQIGGPCNTVYWHVSEISKYNIDPVIITSTLGINEKEVVSNYYLKNKYGKVYYGEGGRYNFRTILHTLKNIKNTDIIHLNGLFDFVSIITFTYCRIFCNKKPIVWSVRGELNPEALVFNTLKKKPILFFYKKNYKKVFFHATSIQEKADIEEKFPHANVFLMPNLLIPYERINNLNKKKQFLFVGRIHEIKGLDKLINAFNLSKKFRNSNYEMIIVGKPEERHLGYYEELKKLISKFELQDKIKFVGHIIGFEKEVYYAESKFLFLPSETENFGNVVVEALNQNTPVIASKGTPWEILEKYKCGFHIENSPDVIAEYIDKIIDMPENTYINYSYNACKLVDENFSINLRIKDWILFYEKILDKN